MYFVWQSLGLVNKELDLVKSLTAVLSSFKEDPGLAPRQNIYVEGPSSRDPDVWPPPTPVEYRCVD